MFLIFFVMVFQCFLAIEGSSVLDLGGRSPAFRVLFFSLVDGILVIFVSPNQGFWLGVAGVSLGETGDVSCW